MWGGIDTCPCMNNDYLSPKQADGHPGSPGQPNARSRGIADTSGPKSPGGYTKHRVFAQGSPEPRSYGTPEGKVQPQVCVVLHGITREQENGSHE